MASDADANDGSGEIREPGDDCREVDAEETGDVGSAYGMIEVSQETLCRWKTKYEVSPGSRFVLPKTKGIGPSDRSWKRSDTNHTRRPDSRRVGDKKTCGRWGLRRQYGIQETR